MTNFTDRERMLTDALDGPEDLRDRSLAQLLSTARGVQRGRRVRKVLSAALVPILAVAVWWFRAASEAPAPKLVERPSHPPAPAASEARFISEDELLDQFPGRAVALVGPPANRRLVFLDVARRP